jgi:flagellar biosynthesis/type III secretory pathway protein FliH
MSLLLSLPDLSRPVPAPAPADPDPLLLAEMRATAEAEGFARGHREGLAEGARRQMATQEAAVEASLASIAASLGGMTDQAAKEADEAADALAATMLTVLDALACTAPALEQTALLSAISEALLPAVAVTPAPRVFVAAELLQLVEGKLSPSVEVCADAALLPGDARIEWPGGARRISAQQRRDAVRHALQAAGFRFEGDEE